MQVGRGYWCSRDILELGVRQANCRHLYEGKDGLVRQASKDQAASIIDIQSQVSGRLSDSNDN